MASSTSAPPQAFDGLATVYDQQFTSTQLARWLREMVRRRIEPVFKPGDHVLELGCGTGEDAIWLAQRGVRVQATDISSSMLAVTQRKVQLANLTDMIQTQRLDLGSLASLDGHGLPVTARFDGVFSNFGPFNCVPNHRALATGLSQIVRPGGTVALVVMAPVCPWEIVWHLFHGEPKVAIRRFRSGAQASVGETGQLPVWYPSARRLRREFDRYFTVKEVSGIGLLLPPTGLSNVVDHAPGLFRRLAALDHKLAGSWLWQVMNDHYLIILERR